MKYGRALRNLGSADQGSDGFPALSRQFPMSANSIESLIFHPVLILKKEALQDMF